MYDHGGSFEAGNADSADLEVLSSTCRETESSAFISKPSNLFTLRAKAVHRGVALQKYVNMKRTKNGKLQSIHVSG